MDLIELVELNNNEYIIKYLGSDDFITLWLYLEELLEETEDSIKNSPSYTICCCQCL